LPKTGGGKKRGWGEFTRKIQGFKCAQKKTVSTKTTDTNVKKGGLKKKNDRRPPELAKASKIMGKRKEPIGAGAPRQKKN